MEIYQIMADNKVINQEIEDPIEHEVAPSARGITEQLLRHDSAERPIEKIDDFGYYLREFVHLLSNSGAKVLLFFELCKRKGSKKHFKMQRDGIACIQIGEN